MLPPGQLPGLKALSNCATRQAEDTPHGLIWLLVMGASNTYRPTNDVAQARQVNIK
jgi:hypothetical protein